MMKGRESLSLMSLYRSQIARAAFHADSTHTHVPDAVLSIYTHTRIHTHHMSVFVLVCCGDKTRLCYTSL